MLKIGHYTYFNGKEYRITKVDNHYELISHDSEDLQRGFIIDDDLYITEVSKDDIEEVFLIKTFGIYENYKFRISMEKDEQYLLWTSEYDLVEKFDLDIRSQGDYEKWVNKEDVEHIYEIKKPMPDYFD
ncbi:hypothetical protein [Neisseria sp. Ec49-e6-T10]|uniref:hypothetical protein n=1 Tax=Neisseria sp. Ec49-e6-T10 TaxID=3140744 RepID=UPI003EB81049